MRNRLTYRHTVLACYFANFFQAVGCVFPIILVPLRSLFGISFTQYGALVAINFMTQISSDVLFSKAVDRFGFRRFMVGAPILVSFGLLLFAATPTLFRGHEFTGFCLGTFLFAAGGGLQELLLSPILDALPLPKEDRARNMSMLHSFFAWGQIFVVLVTTSLLALLGSEGWRIIVSCWAAVPLLSCAFFTLVPMNPRVKPGNEMPIRALFRNRIFRLAMLAILFGGAAEVTMAQWASAFIDRALHLPKLVGDTLGVCGFSFMLALGRTLYGLRGKADGIHRLMILGSIGAMACYLIAALSASPIVSLIACALTGLCVSLLWPGSVIVASGHLPMAGASMFALLSAMGDTGASLASFVTGRISDTVRALPFGLASGEQAGLRAGLLFAALFCVGCLVVQRSLARAARGDFQNTRFRGDGATL